MDKSTMPVVKAKVALLEAKRITEIGRGRISLENHAWLAAEANDGRRFSDWPKGKVTETVVTKDDQKITVARVEREAGADPINSEYLTSNEYRFPENEYKAVTGTGTTYGMREACNVCHLSLVNHICETPSVLGYPVTIVRR